MKNATLCFIVKENEILLGMKKRGFGKGKLNGFGGKLNQNETVEEATVRELYEEAGVKVDVDDLEKMAELTFIFPYMEKGKWGDNITHVFFAEKWEGEPKDSEEMSVHWLEKENLPFEKMWDDDSHWIPLLLNNKKLKAKFTFGKDNSSVIDYKIDEVENF